MDKNHSPLHLDKKDYYFDYLLLCERKKEYNMKNILLGKVLNVFTAESKVVGIMSTLKSPLYCTSLDSASSFNSPFISIEAFPSIENLGIFLTTTSKLPEIC